MAFQWHAEAQCDKAPQKAEADSGALAPAQLLLQKAKLLSRTVRGPDPGRAECDHGPITSQQPGAHSQEGGVGTITLV